MRCEAIRTGCRRPVIFSAFGICQSDLRALKYNTASQRVDELKRLLALASYLYLMIIYQS